jgi:uncharacterized protein (TIGR03086 family)
MNENAVTGWDVLDSAHRALRSVALGMASDDGERPTPCERWTVTQVLQHAAGDQLAWAAAITGGSGPADNPFTPSGQLAGTPLAVVDEALHTAVAAWATVGVYAGDVPSPLPQGPLPASLAAGACALDAAIHAWDIAVATGQPSPLTPALAEPLHAAASQIVEPLRGFAYAPPLGPQPGDDDIAALLHYLGRRPEWTGSRPASAGGHDFEEGFR